ncbi:PE domain-containing protein [Amycolatopsis regifaucium]|uniref:PE domain-containing protein n=1 Tax=Amycolatopsis regifaucium TaxID=546365 RepID=A0A154ML91_9PSEU|nr:PE domain-containing protein [Amycolatopsis regifaucium]KZB85128.1 hypothetical protein AVL48_02725 [Amycolatopsis regifaucium]OKA04151.1 hypothetical protein ATP06_0233585 [Amycolatopsis regifaucium]SFH93047.1 PE family protein [Amycolatopsis regifaucium]
MAASSKVQDLASAVPAPPSVADIRVDPSKLLEVAKIVEEQVDALQDKLLTRLDQLRIDTPANDTVSVHATSVWNELVADGDASYAAQVRAYVAGLRGLVKQLRTAAKEYKTSDADKAAAFGDRGAHPA